MIALEICVDDAAGIVAATEGGADRIELCAALAVGGLTPSAGLMRIAARGPLPCMAMIRPRAGSFVWAPAELPVLLGDIAAARAAGLSGIVVGASLPDGRLDTGILTVLMARAGDLDVTLHRAIDLTPDPVEAMAVCADLGILRVLSSGGARSALAGLGRLKAMAEAGGQVVVMPGGGVTAANVAALGAHLPLSEVHASCGGPLPPAADPRLADFGFQLPDAKGTDRARVAALRAALDQISGSASAGCTSP